VIEYSDLPDKLAHETNPDGSLKFNAGSIGIHAMRVSFLERLNSSGQFQLPWHRAEKKVAYVDRDGNVIKPEKVNAVKVEQFVFDAIPLAANPLVYTTERGEEFSPVKNPQGVDSLISSRRDQIRRHAVWLEACGVKVPRDANGEVLATIEISPLYAATFDQIKMRKLTFAEVKPGDVLYLE
jgi:UDP-N-acetylglucosamine/UDP-N-acetylgalactosamine diphosphorylase